MTRLRMLDLFCGKGGASAAMVDRGWSVVRVDIRSDLAADVVGDAMALPIRGQFDLIWASPPCTEYSRSFLPWMRGKYPAPDLSLWQAAIGAVAMLRPRWYVIENVKGAQDWWGRADWCSNPVYLWGRFPPLGVRLSALGWKQRLSSSRREDRAVIPYALSLDLARSCETAAALFPVSA